MQIFIANAMPQESSAIVLDTTGYRRKKEEKKKKREREKKKVELKQIKAQYPVSVANPEKKNIYILDHSLFELQFLNGPVAKQLPP